MYEVNDGVGWIWKSTLQFSIVYYSIAEKHQILNSGMEMRWMKYGMR